MPKFVCRHNDARETAGVLNYGHTVYLGGHRSNQERSEKSGVKIGTSIGPGVR